MSEMTSRKYQERYQALIQRGWSPEGARFLLGKNLPAFWLFKLFGERHERSQQKTECERCGYRGVALDRHHVHGRKSSSETIVLCANCHREVHAGESLERKK